jgi:hypothetical protein
MGRLVLITALLCSFAVTNFVAYPVWAQGTPQEKTELTGTRRQVATIIFSGLAGAILGLSTLSFYGRPQDNLNNVAIGGAVGIIVGTVYVTYKSATRPSENYDTAEMILDQQLAARDVGTMPHASPQLRLSWDF